jgi:hypothetical protein
LWIKDKHNGDSQYWDHHPQMSVVIIVVGFVENLTLEIIKNSHRQMELDSSSSRRRKKMIKIVVYSMKEMMMIFLLQILLFLFFILALFVPVKEDDYENG